MYIKKILPLLALLILSFTVNANAEAVNALLHQSDDPVIGNRQGKVTIVEFFDYQCSYCVKMIPVISAILQKNRNVRVIFKEYPIRGEPSVFASRAALAANMQGKYYQFSHALLNAKQPLTRYYITKVAKEIGLNMNQFNADLKSQRITQTLSNNFRLAQTLDVTGTPAFFIANSQSNNMQEINYIAGAMTQNEIQHIINDLIKQR